MSSNSVDSCCGDKRLMCWVTFGCKSKLGLTLLCNGIYIVSLVLWLLQSICVVIVCNCFVSSKLIVL